MKADVLKKLTGRQKNFLIIGVCGLLVLFLYGNTLFSGFVYDDKQQVVENEYIRSFSYLPKVITGCIWESAFGQCKDRALYWRPFHSFSYLVSYQISSEPWIFHLLNVVYFFFILVLLFLVARELTSHTFFAALAAFLFAMHPINTEVVNWVSAVPDLTFALFSLLTVYLYIRFQKREKFALKKLLYVYGAYVLALFAKEPALLLPAILLLLDVAFFRKSLASLFARQSLRTYAGFALLSALALLLRFGVLGSLFPQGATPHGGFTFAEHVYAFVALLGKYA